jgi:hypothetical protein
MVLLLQDCEVSVNAEQALFRAELTVGYAGARHESDIHVASAAPARQLCRLEERELLRRDAKNLKEI